MINKEKRTYCTDNLAKCAMKLGRPNYGIRVKLMLNMAVETSEQPVKA